MAVVKAKLVQFAKEKSALYLLERAPAQEAGKPNEIKKSAKARYSQIKPKNCQDVSLFVIIDDIQTTNSQHNPCFADQSIIYKQSVRIVRFNNFFVLNIAYLRNFFAFSKIQFWPNLIVVNKKQHKC
ncbi:hypothetical protein RFI_03213 [Reticulomyxa filosa]|uniref:Uncharacterized protein n=1 Tax=Reticulomyxa filosa TaxID=46433 RepID=X6P759_RETFI|nr:hypothetical protein RFI_03213 [Reticulomyxa filosa]|eukprot:ETO33884.1 hypothetical protein RFI_03213 [Reticulomyxa filosa]